MTLVKKIVFVIFFMLLLTMGTLVWFMSKMNRQFCDFQDKVQEKRGGYENQVIKIEGHLKKGRAGVKKEVKGALKDVEDAFLRNREERARISKEFLKNQKEGFDKIGSFQRY